jgi:hypothetical protein
MRQRCLRGLRSALSGSDTRVATRIAERSHRSQRDRKPFAAASFAINNGATVLEPYANDALCAFDPGWVGVGSNNFTACNNAGYATAFMAAAEALDVIQ